MAPTTRSQTTRAVIATSSAPPAPTLEHQHDNPDAHSESSSHPRRVPPDYLTNDPTWQPSSSSSSSRRAASAPDEPPTFTIDLSRAPEHRYDELCAAYRAEMRNLTALFDEVVAGITRVVPARALALACRLLLRRVRGAEETRELRGIAAATGVHMYLLVCFNVLLDLFMGCSSGGAAVRGEEGEEEGNGGEEEEEEEKEGSKMVHFRTLDWGMPALRRVVVKLDFVAESGGPVLASSITYAGFVGVLTGVRKDFSVSLNFRPNRNDRGKFGADMRYYWHLAMVLLGQRRSIASELRAMLLPKNTWKRRRELKAVKPLDFWAYEEVVPQTAEGGQVKICGKPMTTTACYLCFSNGHETTVLEKDRVTAVMHRSKDFIVVTNNDTSSETTTEVVDLTSDEAPSTEEEASPYASALAEIVHEAKDRKQCAEHNYHNQRAVQARQRRVRVNDTAALQRVMAVDDIVQLVQKYPTTNETTHFACVMDPRQGRVRWCRRWRKPITARWIREHQSDTW